ncbi:MAG: hypothetical protein RLY86_2483 [Pseudomonadota bacterium]
MLRLLAVMALTLLAGAAKGAGGTGGTGGTQEAAGAPPPTRLEAAISARAGEDLRQYGYRLFESAGTRAEPALGQVPDSYVLGPGDTLSVTLRGQTVGEDEVVIGTDGMLVTSGLAPIPAAGRPLGEVRAALAAEVTATLFDTRLFLSLAAPRRMTVLVVGEVVLPGRHDLSAFATVLDALFAAGGVTRQGSLRAIRVLGLGPTDTAAASAAPPSDGTGVDLYDLLHQGAGAADLRLIDGARIVVPPIGPTIAIAGAVQRPGIYEMPPDGSALTAADLVDLAGGPLRPGPERYLRATIGQDGSETVVPVVAAAALRPGDILFQAPARSDRRASAHLLGHVHAPGPRALPDGATLGDLLDRVALRDDAYLPFAVRVGLDPATGARRPTALHAGYVLAGGGGEPMADGDSLVILGPTDIAFLSSRAVLDLLAGSGPPTPGGAVAAEAGEAAACPGLAALAARLAADGAAGTLAAAPATLAAAGLTGPDLPCPPLFRDQPDLLPFALDHAVLVRRGVLRPGLYPAAPDAPLADLVKAAGGAPVPGRHEAPAGRSPGRLVDAEPAAVTLTGAVRDPGRRILARAPDLRSLLTAPGTLADDAYGLLAVLDRWDTVRLTRTLIPFSPADVLAGRGDLALADGDRIRILDRETVRTLLRPARPRGLDERETERPAPEDEAAAGDAAAGALDRTAGTDTAAGPGRTRTGNPGADGNTGDEADLGDGNGASGAALVRLLRTHAVAVRGEVAMPGLYPVAGDVTLPDLLAAAGGLTPDADGTGVELIGGAAWTDGGAGGGGVAGDGGGGVAGVPSSRPLPPAVATAPLTRVSLAAGGHAGLPRLRPGDAVRIPRVSPPPPIDGIVLSGEVRQPGRYDLRPGETLSAVLARAGGLAAGAYAAGAIFTRDSARRAERQGLLRAADELDRSMAMSLLRPDPPDAGRVEMARRLSLELRSAQPVGRITVEADPAILALRPELDIVLEPGDRIHVPKRPLTVTVSGEVLSPASLQFAGDKRARDYLREAGGLTRNADEDRIFILLPDGSARPLAAGAGRHGLALVPPGSTIIVPRDPEPYEFLNLASTVTTILSQLALTGAAIVAVAD